MDAYRLLVNRDLPRRERMCTSKVPFSSRREAASASSHRRGTGGQLSSYHCPYCDQWHLGHKRAKGGPR